MIGLYNRLLMWDIIGFVFTFIQIIFLICLMVLPFVLIYFLIRYLKSKSNYYKEKTKYYQNHTDDRQD